MTVADGFYEYEMDDEGTGVEQEDVAGDEPITAQSLEFGLLTLLSGLNGQGKSSILQALLLLRQSRQQGLLPQTGLVLNG